MNNVMADNREVGDALSILPPQAYNYAPDTSCPAEGREIRLLQNINVAAGLVTSQTGTIVKVIYNNDDTRALLAGEHAVPCCIIVSFSTFRVLLRRQILQAHAYFPFPNQPSWLPIFRKHFSMNIHYLLS